MASKIFVFVCVQLALFNAAYSQCVNRVPNCGCSNILPVAETILPNQVLINQIPNQVMCNQLPNQVLLNQIPNQVLLNQLPNILPNQFVYNQLPTVETVLPSPVATTTIIQDSTVANNLANALQLLVVSNLLSNTLPMPCAGPLDVLPNYGGPIEVLPSYGGPIEVLPSYGGPIEVLPSYGGPVEVVSPYRSASPCGCGLGGYNFIY